MQHSSAAQIYSMCTLIQILILALYNKDTFTYLFQGNLFKQSNLRLSDHGGDKSFGLKAKIDSTENMNKAKIYIKNFFLNVFNVIVSASAPNTTISDRKKETLLTLPYNPYNHQY